MNCAVNIVKLAADVSLNETLCGNYYRDNCFAHKNVISIQVDILKSRLNFCKPHKANYDYPRCYTIPLNKVVRVCVGKIVKVKACD